MKKIQLLLVLITFFTGVFSQNLYKIDFTKPREAEQLIDRKNIDLHYVSDQFCIASGQMPSDQNTIKLDSNPWVNGKTYYLIWLPAENRVSYLDELRQTVNIIYNDNQIAVARTSPQKIRQVKIAVHGGLVKIQNHAVRKTTHDHLTEINKNEPDSLIQALVSEVSTDSIIADIQFMEDLGTRVYNTPEAETAQDWIQQHFERYGLETELTYPGTEGAQNVIATQPGLIYPDKIIVIGGHYDSTSWSGDAPGADDNASGTAGVLEIARILSQKLFNYTIIYCTWSAEEIGLVGSGQWASDAAAEGLDIQGYLNLDMIGYLEEGSEYHTDIMAPESAQPLVELYESAASVYVEDFTTYEGSMTGGDSDHTSFNNNGYMGIFPFEDSEDYSPYIHTSDDLIGPSVNSPEQAKKFTQAGLAFMATMAEHFNGLYPPMNLSLQQEDDHIDLIWNKPLQDSDSFTVYTVYRNDTPYGTIDNINDTIFTDAAVANGQTYNYYITASYEGEVSGESSASNTVSVTMGLMQTHFWNFENSSQEWDIQNNANGWQWGVPVSLNGNSTNYLSIDSDEAGSGNHVQGYAISPVIDLSDATVAYLEFDYGYSDYGEDEFNLVYRTAASDEWTEITDLAPSSNFMHETIELPPETFTSTTELAFHYDDNDTWAWYAGVDNVEVIQAQGTDVLQAPENLSASIGDNAIELSWQNVNQDNFQHYRLYRNQTLHDTIADINTATYTDTSNLVNGTSYTYFLTAMYAEGESEHSNEVTVVYENTFIGNSVKQNSKIYPNPVSQGNNIHIVEDAPVESIAVYNIAGTRLYPGHKLNRKIIHTKTMKPGIYFIKIQTQNASILKKVIVTR